jgi:hypothetical protein
MHRFLKPAALAAGPKIHMAGQGTSNRNREDGSGSVRA